MTNYNDGKWHGHNGGECPVHPETVVDARYECGMVMDDWKAGDLTWSFIGPRLIAFRVIKEHKEPREFWLFWSDEKFGWCVSSNEEYAYSQHPKKDDHPVIHNSPIIHVREVIE